jgi:hypothetical protein
MRARARVFISHAHADLALALQIDGVLRKHHFATFLDRDELLVGEHFPQRLAQELKAADAVVALLTPAFAKSDWCQAELHQAYARGVPVLPLLASEAPVVLPEPLRVQQATVHRLQLGSGKTIGALGDELRRDLGRLQKRASRRFAMRAAVATASLLLAVAGLWWLASNIESWQDSRRRAELVGAITASEQPVQRELMLRVEDRWRGDEVLFGQLATIARSATRSPAARLSAAALMPLVLPPQDPRDRLVLRDLDWRRATLSDLRLTNVVFANGNQSDLTFHGGALSSVIWGESPSLESDDGMVVANSRFEGTYFYASEFRGTNLTRVQFVNPRFLGGRLDVSSFSLVEISQQSQETREGVITDEIALIENAVVTNLNDPPEPGVMDLGDPRNQVIFRGVVFDGVDFRGWIRPEWFIDCWIRRSVLPTQVTRELLESGGNRIEDVAWLDQEAAH